MVEGKIPYYTECKTEEKTSDLENPPLHGGVGWIQVPESGKQALFAALLLAFLGRFGGQPSFLCRLLCELPPVFPVSLTKSA